MHCSQVSSGAANTQAAQAAYGRKAGGCGETRPAKSREGCGDGERSEAPQASRHEGRPARNPLVSAMMEALKGLMPASASATATAADATTETTATDAAPASASSAATAKEQAKALKEAAYGFAHELFKALKSVGASAADASGGAGHCRPHRCGGYGESAGAASAYGGLAQGLQTLAQSLAPAAVAATTPSDAAVATTPAAGEATAVEAAAATPTTTAKPAELSTVKTPVPASSSGGITINLTLNIGTTAATGPADAGSAASDESPLLAAFKKLMLALNPPSGSATEAETAADAKKPAEMLQAFLQQIAKSLGGSAAATEALPAKGSLIDVSA